MKRASVFILLGFVLAWALVACGGEDADTSPTEEVVVIEMNDIFFGDSNDNAANPPVWRVSSGSNVIVRMNNMGSLEHNWAVLKAGETIPATFDMATQQDMILFSAGEVAAASDGEVSFTAPAPGEYAVLCTVPGHAGLMQGKLIVDA